MRLFRLLAPATILLMTAMLGSQQGMAQSSTRKQPGAKFTTAMAPRFDVEKQLDRCAVKLRASLAQLKDTTRFARNIPAGSTEWKTTKYTDWTGGFYPGQLWYLYEYTQDEFWRKQAERWQGGMEPAKDITWTHDLGFMVNNCFGHAYRLTKDPKYKDVVLTASVSLDKLYNPKVQTMRSWTWMKEWKHPTIIDNMLNLEMQFWAGKNGGKRAVYDNAYQHALKTMKEHLRPNFTTYHVVNYDTATGKPLFKGTHQGLNDSSTWARGQAWGIYGFAMAHRETKDLRFLTTAKKLADVFIKNLPADYVPYWDFNAPHNASEPRDASAAAIAACGLLEISKLVKEPMEQYNYREQAIKILASLSSAAYQAPDNVPAILLHSTGSKPHNSEIDVAMVYADYYYIEALMRLRSIRY